MTNNNTELTRVENTKNDKTYAPFSLVNSFIQKSINDDLQSFVDIDENGQTTTRNGQVRYNYNTKGRPLKGKASAEIVIKGVFSTEESEKALNETITKPITRVKQALTKDGLSQTTYNLLLKKVELLSVETLFNGFSETYFENKEITFTDKELAEKFNVDKSYINRNMNGVITGLSQMQIRHFSMGRKVKVSKNKQEVTNEEFIPDLGIINIIQDAIHQNGVTTLTFNEKLAQHFFLCEPMQLPTKIYKISNNLTFDIALYLYGLVREKNSNTFILKMGTLYDNLRAIPRYEDIKGRKYNEKIYKPIEESINELGSNTYEKEIRNNKGKKKTIEVEPLKLINIKYLDADYIKQNEKIDFKKWKETQLQITFLDTAPDYTTLRENRKQKKLKQKK